MAKKQKFYTVWTGRKTGFFDSWEACQEQIKGFENAQYKSFDSKDEAAKAFKGNYWAFINKEENVGKQTKIPASAFPKPLTEAIAVDAAWNTASGDMEYQGTYLQTGKKLFHQGPFRDGTNNIGEFLAIVHALAFLKKHNSDLPIYSDSRTAIAWLKKKKANTKLEETKHNQELFVLLERAETWLKNNTYPNKVLKWETDYWGENPADFGRK
jgi:ribonuclease HI